MASKEAWRNRIVGHGDEDPTQLLANPKNWRIHPSHQQQALAGALDQVGWVQQVIVNRASGNMVDGHLRVELAISRGEQSVPVVYVDLTDEEESLVLASLDPIGAMAATDSEKLRMLLAEVEFDSHALEEAVSSVANDGTTKREGLTDPDDVPEPSEATWVKRGDLFALGEHRLMCGDATDERDVARLLGGMKADLCLTDPPYGANIAYAAHDDTQDALDKLIAGFLPIARRSASLVALTPGIANVSRYPSADWMLCWFYAAGTGSTPWGFSAWQPILVWGSDPKLAAGEGRHPDGFDWPMTREDAEERKTIAHVVPKPTSSWTKWLDRLSNKNTKRVYDPFAGSGTTLIAAEKTSRQALGMDIDPSYVQVAIERWEAFTGQKAEKIT